MLSLMHLKYTSYTPVYVANKPHAQRVLNNFGAKCRSWNDNISKFEMDVRVYLV